MAEILTDEVLFEGFEDVVDRYLLRSASSYDDALRAVFAPPAVATPVEMFSTKLRGCIDFRPGEVTVWTGYNGHRKSFFTGQLVLDVISQRRRVMLASFEMAPVQTLARMARQAWGEAVPSAEKLTSFGKWTDGRLWLFDHVGRCTPSRCLAMCRYFADAKMGHQVVLDSMMMVCASEERLDEQKQFMTDLVRLAQETGLHVHLVAHCRKPQNGEERPPSKYDLRGSAAIADQAHNVMTVWANRDKKAKLEEGDRSAINEPDALIACEKQRNGRFEGRIKLWFDEDCLRFRDDAGAPLVPYEGLRRKHEGADARAGGFA